MEPEHRHPPRRTDFAFAERLRVRWAEVDAQQVVFNGHYLAYVDTAVAGLWRALALPYESTLQQLGGDLFVRRASVEYLAPARYDDLIEVGLRLGAVGRSSLRMEAAIFHEARLLATAELVYVWTDAASRTPQPVPPALLAALRQLDLGQDPVQVEVGAWAALGPRAQPVRTAVFVQEQGIPAELEYDPADVDCVHAVALNALGAPLATGRLLPTATDGSSRIGRMAVLRPLRGGGVGRRVLLALMAAARARGDRAVTLHAQQSAVPFYLRAGFTPLGEPFEEAGIPHLEMQKAL